MKYLRLLCLPIFVLIVSILWIIGCKRSDLSISPISTNPINAIRQEYNERKLETEIRQKLNDSVSIAFQPEWKKAIRRKINDSIYVTRVPLWPKIYINDSAITSAQVNNNLKQLYVEEKLGTRKFYYLDNLPPKTINKNTEKIAFNHVLKYKELGNPQSKFKYFVQSADTSAKLNNARSGCLYYMECTWGGSCNGIYTVYYSRGTGYTNTVPDCGFPYMNECPYANWSAIVWHYDMYCDDEGAPPPLPAPINEITVNGGTGSGGGNSNPTTPVPGSATAMNTSKGLICGNYAFYNSQGTSWNGNMSGAGVMYYHTGYNIVYNLEFGTICVTIPTYSVPLMGDASNTWKMAWNMTADETLEWLQSRDYLPSSTDVSTKFKALLSYNINWLIPQAKVSFGPCLGPNIPTTAMQYDCN